MSSSRIETRETSIHDKPYNFDRSQELSMPYLEAFKKIIKSYAFFHFFFISLCTIQFLAILLFFTFLAKTSILALSVAIFFFTLFSYLILRLYLYAKKPIQLHELKNKLLSKAKAELNYQEGRADHHMALAEVSCQLAQQLKGLEHHLYTTPAYLDGFKNIFQKISCFSHFKDVFTMRELLIFAAIEEHITFIKFEPTNLEAHASLANAYVLLSGLCSLQTQANEQNVELWLPSEQFQEEMRRKFRMAAERAIEEFKILNDYAPNDPWVHTQLAYSYHDLQMPLEEIKEYETILKISPNDNETLFKLGVLYFEQGFNAKGLQVYEELKRVHYKKAEDLISFYGSYNRF